MRLWYKISLVLFILGTIFLWGRCSRTSTSTGSKVPTVLPSNDAEEITVDPSIHQLIILRPGKRIVETLPDRPSIIDILKNGTVTVTSKQFGFERHMFVGLLGSDHLRIGAGLDGFYWKKLDVGVGIGDQVGAYTPIVFAKVTYNVKGNMQLGLVYQSNRYVGGIISVRVF